MGSTKTIIRRTKSVCPECLIEIEAFIVEREGNVYMDKRCDIHGDFSLLLSRHPDYYAGLDKFYFSLIDRSFLQRDYIMHLTNRCELDCPICLADANRRGTDDYPIDKLKGFLRGKNGYKIDLMGAEPAMRDDLPEIIRMVKKSGNIATLHTNGIRIADFDYLQELKRAGLNEVHLQFDGFDDYVYEKMRGEKLLAIKQKALDNLERLNIATDLVVTIVRGLNEKEMGGILEFGAKHSFVKEIFFLGCRFLGKAKDLPFEGCLMPDELIDGLEAQSQGRISRPNIFKFQKLYFALLAAFSKRKCFYIQHFLLLRNKESYSSIDKVLDLDGVQKQLDKFKELKLKKSRFSTLYLLWALAYKLFTFKPILFLKEFLSFGIAFLKGFDLDKLPKKIILLGFISACDAYSFDYTIAQNCGKGAISIDLGIQDSGAMDNIIRDTKIERNLR